MKLPGRRFARRNRSFPRSRLAPPVALRPLVTPLMLLSALLGPITAVPALPAGVPEVPGVPRVPGRARLPNICPWDVSAHQKSVAKTRPT